MQSISIQVSSHLPQEGGGQKYFKISPFQIVTIGVWREGLQANLDNVTKYPGFFLKASLMDWNMIVHLIKRLDTSGVVDKASIDDGMVAMIPFCFIQIFSVFPPVNKTL